MLSLSKIENLLNIVAKKMSKYEKYVYGYFRDTTPKIMRTFKVD